MTQFTSLIDLAWHAGLPAQVLLAGVACVVGYVIAVTVLSVGQTDG